MKGIVRIVCVCVAAVFLPACDRIETELNKSSFNCVYGVSNDQLTRPCKAVAGNPTSNCARTPSAVFDHNERLWLAWVWGYHVYVNYSDDKGKTFSQPVYVNEIPENIAAKGENRPKIAVSNKGIIYISYTKKSTAPFTGHVRFSRSTNGGKSFSNPVTINNDRQMISHRFDALGVNKKGHVYISWLDKRDRAAARQRSMKYPGAAIYYTVSTDEGRTFQPDKKIIDNSCQCCRIAMDFDQNDLPVLMWRQIYGNNTHDHALVKFSSVDVAGKPVRLSHDNWQVDVCPQHGPALSADGTGAYHLAWFTNSKKQRGLFYARSDNNGRRITKPMPFGNHNRHASHPDILTADRRVFLAWKEFDGNRSYLLLMEQDTGKNKWSRPRLVDSIDGLTDYPFLLMDGKHVYVSWHTVTGGYRLFDTSDPSTLPQEDLAGATPKKGKV